MERGVNGLLGSGASGQSGKATRRGDTKQDSKTEQGTLYRGVS